MPAASLPAIQTSYWHSSEACRFNRPLASSTPHGYLTLIERGWGNKTTEDVEDGLTEYQVWLVHQKIIVLTLALLVAKEKMESMNNWNSCCEEAAIAATRLGIKAGTHLRRVCNWYQNFRIQRKITVLVLPGKNNLPPFLQQNKDIATSIQQYARENLSSDIFAMKEEPIVGSRLR